MAPVGDLLPGVCSQALTSKPGFGSCACTAANKTGDCQSSQQAEPSFFGSEPLLQQHCWSFCAEEGAVEEGTFRNWCVRNPLLFWKAVKSCQRKQSMGLENSFTEKPSNWDEWGP